MTFQKLRGWMHPGDHPLGFYFWHLAVTALLIFLLSRWAVSDDTKATSPSVISTPGFTYVSDVQLVDENGGHVLFVTKVVHGKQETIVYRLSPPLGDGYAPEDSVVWPSDGAVHLQRWPDDHGLVCTADHDHSAVFDSRGNLVR